MVQFEHTTAAIAVLRLSLHPAYTYVNTHKRMTYTIVKRCSLKDDGMTGVLPLNSLEGLSLVKKKKLVKETL